MKGRSQPSAPSLRLSGKARRTREQPISYLMAAAVGNPGLINLAAGLVDDRTLPVQECAAVAQKLFSDPVRGRAALQYDTTLGLAGLRQAALEHLQTLEGKPAAQMALSASNILITTGSQQALYLIGDVLIDLGDIIIAARPSYFVFTGTLASLGATVLTVPMDEDGMDVEGVGRLLATLKRHGKLPRVKLVYCTSYYQNPTGLTLSLERRTRMLEIVRQFSQDRRILILEDAAYRELRYDGPALPSIKSFDPENRYTILTQTFSKPFAPGLKTGYTAMPEDLLEAVLQQKGNHDFGSANLCQHIAMEAMRDGRYARHVKALRQSYRLKRDAMLGALERFMPKAEGLTWTHPHGGLYVWLTLPDAIDTSREGELFQSALRHGVLYVPGDYCFQLDAKGRLPRHHIRLSFGQVATEQIEPGIQRLAEVVEEKLAVGRLRRAQSSRRQLAVERPQSAVGSRRSAVKGRQSVIARRQSPNHKSKIQNRKSPGGVSR